MNEKTRKNTILLIYFLCQPHLKGYSEKLFEEYKEQAWRFFEEYQEKGSMKYGVSNRSFMTDAPIDQYLQACKIFSLFDYRDYLVKKEKTKEVKRLDQSLTNTIFSSLNSEFLMALAQRDPRRIQKFLGTYAKNKKQKEQILDYYIILFCFVPELIDELDPLISESIYNMLEMIDGIANQPILYPKEFPKVFQFYNKDLSESQVFSYRKEHFQKVFDLVSFEYNHYSKEKGEVDFFNKIKLLLSAYQVNLDEFDTAFPPNKADLLNISYVLQNQEDKRYDWFVMALICLCKAYSKARGYVLEQSIVFQHDTQKEKGRVEKEYKKTIRELEKEQGKMKTLLEEKEKKINDLRKEYKGSLEQELLKKEEQIELLERLLNQALEKEGVEGKEEEGSKEKKEERELLPFTEDTSIVVIGGYERLIQRLRSYFPNLENIRESSRIPKKEKEYFLLTRYTEHKMMNLLEASRIEYHFIDAIGVNQMAYEIRDRLQQH